MPSESRTLPSVDELRDELLRQWASAQTGEAAFEKLARQLEQRVKDLESAPRSENAPSIPDGMAIVPLRFETDAMAVAGHRLGITPDSWRAMVEAARVERAR